MSVTVATCGPTGIGAGVGEVLVGSVGVGVGGDEVVLLLVAGEDAEGSDDDGVGVGGVLEALPGTVVVGSAPGTTCGAEGDVDATVPAPGDGWGSAPAALTPHAANGAATVTDRTVEKIDRIFMCVPWYCVPLCKVKARRGGVTSGRRIGENSLTSLCTTPVGHYGAQSMTATVC